jgi:Ca2+-binding RTX toxin-like protein
MKNISERTRTPIVMTMVALSIVMLLLYGSGNIQKLLAVDIIGTDRDDVLIGSGQNAAVSEKNDRFSINSTARDFMFGSYGNDEIRGSGGSDHLAGGPQNDVIYGYDGGDYLQGDDGDDKLSGMNGDDVLVGGSGADYFDCGLGRDTIGDLNQLEGDVALSNCEVFDEEG